MKKIVAILFVVISQSNLIAQYPDEAEIKKHKIKIISRYSEQGNDYFLYDKNGYEIKTSFGDPDFKDLMSSSLIFYNFKGRPDSIIVTGKYNISYRKYFYYAPDGSFFCIIKNRNDNDTIFFGKNQKRIKITRANGSMVKYEYNVKGQLIKETDIDITGIKTYTVYTYNPAGKIIIEKTSTPGDFGTTSNFEYDQKGLLVKKSVKYPSSTFVSTYKYQFRQPGDTILEKPYESTKKEVDVPKHDKSKQVTFSKPIAGDITPEIADNIRYEHITGDMSNNLYVVKGKDNKTYTVLTYNGSDWKDISLNASGWSRIFDLKADNSGTLYMLAMPDQVNYYLYRYSSGQWDTIPVGSLGGRIRSLYINQKNELLVRGKFTNEKGPYFIAVYFDRKWVSLGQSFNNPVIEKAFQNYSGSEMVQDLGGRLYVELFRYSKPESRSYIAVLDNQSWTILDTLSYPLNTSIPDLAVNKSNELFFTGHFKNEKGEYVVVNWNGNSWSLISTNAQGYMTDRLESVATTKDGSIITAGWMKKNYEYLIGKWEKEVGWQTYATCDVYLSKIITSSDCVYALGKSEKRIFCFTEGSKVKEDQNQKLQRETITRPLSILEEKKDIKANEMWNIYKDYLRTYEEKYKEYNYLCNYIFEKDQKGKYKNQYTWKLVASKLNDEIALLKPFLEEYLKKARSLNLNVKENLLADAFQIYLKELTSDLFYTTQLTDQLKLGMVTDELIDAVKDVNKKFDDVSKSINKLNAEVIPYKKRNAILN